MSSDASLVHRATAGDERAFSAIFDRYHQALYRFCLAILGQPADAQDALQNTMVKVLRSLPGEERQIELKPWLYRIARNESIELLRRRHQVEELDPELIGGAALTEKVEARDRLRKLIGDLGELPERQRSALVMRELSGLGFEAISAALETSPTVARQTVYEARLSLRQMEGGREMPCDDVTRALSDGDGRVARRRDIRAHLRHCESCRRFREEIAGRERDLSALAPLPAVAATGLLHALLGGQAGAAAGTSGAASAAAGGAAKTIGVSAAMKATATVAVVAAIGTVAADREGLVNVGLPGGGGSQTAPATPGGGDGGEGSPASSSQGTSENGAAAGDAANGAAKLGGSAAAGKAANGKRKGQDGDSAADDTESASSGANGHGRERSQAASAHGKSTSAEHRSAQHGKSGTHSHPTHPTKPAHPAKPQHPAQASKPSHPETPPPASASEPNRGQAPQEGPDKGP